LLQLEPSDRISVEAIASANQLYVLHQPTDAGAHEEFAVDDLLGE